MNGFNDKLGPKKDLPTHGKPFFVSKRPGACNIFAFFDEKAHEYMPLHFIY